MSASPGRFKAALEDDLPEAVVTPEDGTFIWPDGIEVEVGNDGETVLGMDGRVLQSPDGTGLIKTEDGKVQTVNGVDYRILVYKDARCLVITAEEGGRFVDRHGHGYTTYGDRIQTAIDGRPLASKDGRYVVCIDNVLQLEDSTLVARGPDSTPATWIDGSVVVVSPDNRTVLGPDGKVLFLEGRSIEIDEEGYLTEAIGSYVIHTSHERSRQPSGSGPGQGNEVHTRSVQLKEALNNANMELRAVKDALELNQAELITEKARSKAKISEPPPASISSELQVFQNQIQDLSNQLQHERASRTEAVERERTLRMAAEEKTLKIEAEARQQKFVSDDLIAELQRELRDASHEDTAALQRLKLAVEAQGRRVSTREEELTQVKTRLKEEEDRTSAMHVTMHSERGNLQNEHTKLAEAHKAVTTDYNILRQRAHELEEAHLKATDKMQNEMLSLRAQLEDLKRWNRSLEEKAITAERTTAAEAVKGDELMHVQHLLDMEASRRQRAEHSLEELRKQHDAHTEEAFGQLTNITIDRDRYMRLLREKEREVDEVTWEKNNTVKETQRHKTEAQQAVDSIKAIKDAKGELEIELAKERQLRKSEQATHATRLLEVQEEKDTTLKIIPNAIKESERGKAVAEERASALQRQLREQADELSSLRVEIAEAHQEVEDVKRHFREKERAAHEEISSLKDLEREYRRDRKALEDQIESTQSGTKNKDERVVVLQRELERVTRKKEKSEKRRITLEALSLRSGNSAPSEEMMVEMAGLRRERDEALALINVQEGKWRRIMETVEERDGVVEALRQQIAVLQKEKQAILMQREEAANSRLLSLRNTAYHSVLTHMVSPPPVSPPVLEVDPPALSPTALWNSMPYQAVGQSILATPAPTVATPQSPIPSSVRKSIRWTSPARERNPELPNPMEYLPKCESLVAEPAAHEYQRILKYNLARNHPPVSPLPMR